MGKPSKHIETRNKLKSIADVSTFNEIIDSVILPPQYKELLKMFYIENMSLAQISTALSIEESTVRVWHRKALSKVSDILLIYF